MADEFFDDEQELMEAAAADGGSDAGASDARPARTAAAEGAAAPATDAPPFWMVVAIAAIALVLGVVIGYLIGTSTAMSAMQAAGTSSSAQETQADSSQVLPEGHPQLDIDEDGTATVVEGDQGSAQA